MRIFLLRSGLLLFGIAAIAAPSKASPVPGQQLPTMVLTSAAGGTRPVWSKGQITVVAFCAFWCDTWKEQSQRMASARQALRGLPVSWTIVSVDGRWSDKGQGSSWSSIAKSALLDTGGRWTSQLGIHSVPTTMVVDGEGTVRFAGQGIARSQVLRDAVRAAMEGRPVASAPAHLVFDDFPSRDPRLDDRLLDVLRAAGVKAAFCGDKARQSASPVIVRRALAEGHRVQGPFGSPNGAVDPFDWKRPGQDELCRRVLCAAGPDKTILLHAGISETIDALPFMLDSLRKQGLDLSN